MNTIEGVFFDGVSAQGKPARLFHHAPGVLLLEVARQTRTWPLEQLSIPARVGNTPRFIRFPDGGTFETADNAAVDRILAAAKSRDPARLPHFLEASWPMALAAALLTLGVGWVLITQGAPLVARWVAMTIPASWEEELGQTGLNALKRAGNMTASKLPAARLAEVQALFRQTVRRLRDLEATQTMGALSDSDRFRFRLLVFHSKRFGANAFALPSGIILVTDALIELTREDGELEAVLAHELGHVLHRHAFRRLLQDATTALLVSTLIGDASALANLAAGLPVLLIEMRYSRQFEAEADRFAGAYMERTGRPPKLLYALLDRMAEKKKGKTDGFDLPAYFSSHPTLDDRRETLDGARAAP